MPHAAQDPFEAAATALAKRPDQAERQARALMARLPGDPRPQLILASALRRQGKAGGALAMLVELARRYPRAARTRYELGLCLIQVQRAGEGAEQLRAAVTLDPKLVEAWQALADVAFAAGDVDGEMAAQGALARLACTDPQVGRGAEMIALGQQAKAEPILRQHLLRHPHDPQALRLLAVCYLAGRGFDHAETLLRHALSVEGDFDAARFDLARVLFARQQAELALVELAPLLERAPDHAAYRNLQAGCLALLGDDAGAEALHAGLAQEFPGNAGIAINHGHALRTTGARAQAIAEYRRALTLRPQTGEAWWSLANLKVTEALAGPDEAAMEGLLARPLPDADRLHLEYALGRRYEDAGDAAQAFDHYAKGAAIVRRNLPEPPGDYEAQAREVAALFTRDFLAERADWGVPAQEGGDAPIFVVGLPRSGSTLVEQILASHSTIEGTMELPYVSAIAGRLAQNGGDAALAQATRDQVRAWGDEYLLRARLHRRLGRARFIDKMPKNFKHIGLIRLMLPHARIIDVRRHPMASCFSGFKQLFAEGQEFSYDLTDLARYYRHYLTIIRHFHAVAPGAVHTLRYEDLIEDTESRVRELLTAVGVDFEPSCLRFFENNRAVRTVSSEQVRQPIYRSGLDHWRAFEASLAPLASGLGDALDTWRD